MKKTVIFAALVSVLFFSNCKDKVTEEQMDQTVIDSTTTVIDSTTVTHDSIQHKVVTPSVIKDTVSISVKK